MALDGFVISNIVYELNQTILGAHISKIAQPETDELLLTLKGSNGQYRLSISANPSLPFVYLTKQNKQSPLVAPTFCMVLRKHIANGKIVRIEQPNMERIIHLHIEHRNELGDLCQKILIIELMGKHSNIIFCRDDGLIVDSIKHISSVTSSLREVLPGRQYSIAATQTEKHNPLNVNMDLFIKAIQNRPLSVSKAIYMSFTGLSPLAANEIVYLANIDGDISCCSLTNDQLIHLYHHFNWFIENIKEHRYNPTIIRNGKEPVEFYSILLKLYSNYTFTHYDSISTLLEEYYHEKNTYSRIHQKSTDLRRIITSALEKNYKKFQLLEKQMNDTKKKDLYKIYGDLLLTFGYQVKPNSKFIVVENYYDNNKQIQIPLNPDLTPQENAKKYYDKYNKLKRTKEASIHLLEETKDLIQHLESISTSIEMATSNDDLMQIKDELIEFGFIKKNSKKKKEVYKNKPLHYISSDGYDIYVGKNNYQNDELTFKFANGNDWWFHAKDIPGSHVIVKSKEEELPDRVFEEAGRLAGYYSKARNAQKVEIDYLQKKNIKKPNKRTPGFVIYYTNYSLNIEPDIDGLLLLNE